MKVYMVTIYGVIANVCETDPQGVVDLVRMVSEGDAEFDLEEIKRDCEALAVGEHFHLFAGEGDPCEDWELTVICCEMSQEEIDALPVVDDIR